MAVVPVSSAVVVSEPSAVVVPSRLGGHRGESHPLGTGESLAVACRLRGLANGRPRPHTVVGATSL